jgi:hypothetical protein
MPPAGFEPAVPEIERLLTHALDGAATGIGWVPENAKGKRQSSSLAVGVQRTSGLSLSMFSNKVWKG